MIFAYFIAVMLALASPDPHATSARTGSWFSHNEQGRRPWEPNGDRATTIVNVADGVSDTITFHKFGFELDPSQQYSVTIELWHTAEPEFATTYQLGLIQNVVFKHNEQSGFRAIPSRAFGTTGYRGSIYSCSLAGAFSGADLNNPDTGVSFNVAPSIDMGITVGTSVTIIATPIN